MAKKDKPGMSVSVIEFPEEKSIAKSDKPTNIEPESEETSNDWLTHQNFENMYRFCIDNSTILPQCIESYKNNIAGFGIGVHYKEDYRQKETPEMEAEFKLAKNIVQMLSFECDTKDIFEQLIEDAESYGIGYLEVIRNIEGKVVEVVNISQVDSITKSKKEDIFTPFNYYIENNVIIKRQKRFRRYKQEIGGKTVYFKELGDPRILDKNSGEYLTSGNLIDTSQQANEIFEFKLGNKPYGDVRWIGCMYPIKGSAYAESLNLNYFKNGRHTPLAICIENGKLSESSRTKLQEYANNIRGENGQHAFLVLEMEAIQEDIQWSKNNPPKVTLKEMASVLQKDELFGDYIENNRRKVQSAFNLPDIYVGYTTDFNRATAYAAMTVTEQQVFQPYRQRLAWAVNHKLLNEYNFKYVEVFFEAPKFNNPDDIKTILDATAPYGSISPNCAKEIAYEQLGKDCEDYDFEGADLPLSISQQQAFTMAQQLETQVKKATVNGDDEIVPVLKSLLSEFKKIQNKSGSEKHGS